MKYIGFVTGRTKRAIADHFDISYELENEISGTSKEKYLTSVRYVMNNAILCGETLMGNEPFGVILADDLCLPDVQGGQGIMSQMAQVYAETGCSVVALMEVPIETISKYGVIAGEDLGDGKFQVTDMIEKPAVEDAPSNLAIIGRYILTPDIFDIIRQTPPGKNGEIQLTDALLAQAKQGRVIGYKFKGLRFDCGSVKGFVDATNYVFKNIYQDI